MCYPISGGGVEKGKTLSDPEIYIKTIDEFNLSIESDSGYQTIERNVPGHVECILVTRQRRDMTVEDLAVEPSTDIHSNNMACDTIQFEGGEYLPGNNEATTVYIVDLYTTNAVDSGTADVVHPDTFDAVDRSTADVVDPDTFVAVDPDTDDVVEPDTAAVVDPGSFDAVDCGTADVVDPDTADAVGLDTDDVDDPDTFDAADTRPADAVDSDTANAVDQKTFNSEIADGIDPDETNLEKYFEIPIGFDTYVCHSNDEDHLLDDLDSDYGDWETGIVSDSEKQTLDEKAAEPNFKNNEDLEQIDDTIHYEEILIPDAKPTIPMSNHFPKASSNVPYDVPPTYTPFHVLYERPPPSYEETSCISIEGQSTLGVSHNVGQISTLDASCTINKTFKLGAFHAFVEDTKPSDGVVPTAPTSDVAGQSDTLASAPDLSYIASVDSFIIESEVSMNKKSEGNGEDGSLDSSDKTLPYYSSLTHHWTYTDNPNYNLRLPEIQPSATAPPLSVSLYPAIQFPNPLRNTFRIPPSQHDSYNQCVLFYGSPQAWHSPVPTHSRSTSPNGHGGGSHGIESNATGSNGAGSFPSSSPALPDPYDSLKPETQRFIDNITNMGFMRARVSRSVEKLGENDKKVVFKGFYVGDMSNYFNEFFIYFM